MRGVFQNLTFLDCRQTLIEMYAVRQESFKIHTMYCVKLRAPRSSLTPSHLRHITKRYAAGTSSFILQHCTQGCHGASSILSPRSVAEGVASKIHRCSRFAYTRSLSLCSLLSSSNPTASGLIEPINPSDGQSIHGWVLKALCAKPSWKSAVLARRWSSLYISRCSMCMC